MRWTKAFIPTLREVPAEAEVHGLLALMLHCEARRAARRGPDGRYVPLSEQDFRQWSRPLIEEAEQHLADAASRRRRGRFQLEAAIQSVHAERARSGQTEWGAIVFFYEQLMHISPTLGTRTGYAAAAAEIVSCHPWSRPGYVCLSESSQSKRLSRL